MAFVAAIFSFLSHLDSFFGIVMQMGAFWNETIRCHTAPCNSQKIAKNGPFFPKVAILVIFVISN